MEQTGEYRIAASRADVWAALNDPDVLARCIDGCESMEKVADDRFTARVKAKVGPVRATFNAELVLEDIDPPNSYTINAQVKGGAAGFARGRAMVSLEEADAQTALQYRVEANVGGKLAQVGSRLIDGAARKMADDFFSRFGEQVGGAAPVPVTPDGVDANGASAATPAAQQSGGRWMLWVVAAAALLAALVLAL